MPKSSADQDGESVPYWDQVVEFAESGDVFIPSDYLAGIAVPASWKTFVVKVKEGSKNVLHPILTTKITYAEWLGFLKRFAAATFGFGAGIPYATDLGVPGYFATLKPEETLTKLKIDDQRAVWNISQYNDAKIVARLKEEVASINEVADVTDLMWHMEAAEEEEEQPKPAGPADPPTADEEEKKTRKPANTGGAGGEKKMRTRAAGDKGTPTATVESKVFESGAARALALAKSGIALRGLQPSNVSNAHLSKADFVRMMMGSFNFNKKTCDDLYSLVELVFATFIGAGTHKGKSKKIARTQAARIMIGEYLEAITDGSDKTLDELKVDASGNITAVGLVNLWVKSEPDDRASFESFLRLDTGARITWKEGETEVNGPANVAHILRSNVLRRQEYIALLAQEPATITKIVATWGIQLRFSAFNMALKEWDKAELVGVPQKVSAKIPGFTPGLGKWVLLMVLQGVLNHDKKNSPGAALLEATKANKAIEPVHVLWLGMLWSRSTEKLRVRMDKGEAGGNRVTYASAKASLDSLPTQTAVGKASLGGAVDLLSLSENITVTKIEAGKDSGESSDDADE